MKMIIANTALIALLTGCALPQAQAEQPEQVTEQETRIVVMQDGEKKEWRFSGDNWRDSDQWQQFIAGLEPEQQHKLEKLLAAAPPVPPMPPHSPKVSWQEHDAIKQIVIHKHDGELSEQQLIEIHHQAGEHHKQRHISIQREVGEHSFAAIQRLLQSTELSKDQLQQLQALLDSKH
jgi:hypothetical protein